MQVQPNIDLQDDDFGAVLNCAVRYSLGRFTYMPSLVIGYITPLIPFLTTKTLLCMERDITEWLNGSDRQKETYGFTDIVTGWCNFNSKIAEVLRQREATK